MTDSKCKVTFATPKSIFIKCGKQRFAIIPKTKLERKMGNRKGHNKEFKKYIAEVNALRNARLSDVKSKYGKKNIVPEKF